MDLAKANSLINSYHEYIRPYVSNHNISDGWLEVQTFFLNHRRDTIAVYIKETEEGIEINDNGEILSDLELIGLTLDDKEFEYKLYQILLSHGVKIKLNNQYTELYKITTQEKFPSAFREFMQCILTLDSFNNG
jgi:hypothetical protein